MSKPISISVTQVENNNSTQCNYIRNVICDDGSVWESSDKGTWYKVAGHSDFEEQPVATPSPAVSEVDDRMVFRACEAHINVQHRQNEGSNLGSLERQHERMRAALLAALGEG